MGSSVPPKWFAPPAPYGSSPAANTVNPVAPAAQNPQVPLLPPNFSDPGTTVRGVASAPARNPIQPGGSTGFPRRPYNPLYDL